MSAPTLYFLEISQRPTGEYEVWERHRCQERGCVFTDYQFVDLVQTKSQVQAIIDDWRINPPLDGVLEDVSWEELPQLEDIDIEDVTDDFCGTYSDYPEMINSICELSGLKAYRIVRDGEFRGYTFEVVE